MHLERLATPAKRQNLVERRVHSFQLGEACVRRVRTVIRLRICCVHYSRYLQRDVEVHIEAVDKTGGFIGTLYLTKPDKTVENAAVALTQEGLAFVHHHSAENLSWSRQLFDAEVWFLFQAVLRSLSSQILLGIGESS